jgi:hypothetical protein
MFNPPRGAQRTRDPALPTVQLLRVLNRCWSDDTDLLKDRAVMNSRLGERCEEPDRSAVWSNLGHAIHNVWPDLKGWIMNYAPPEDNTHWFIGADRIGVDEYECIEDPDIATKYSSSERVGFFSTFSSSPSPTRLRNEISNVLTVFCRPSFIVVSPNAYMAACVLILSLAARRTNFQCLLEAGMNPFFIIYAFADCDVPLPGSFSLELFWKHLDAIISAKCWRGLGADRTAIQGSTRGGAVPMLPEFEQESEDPEGIVGALLILSLRSELPEQVADPVPVHQVCIVITGDQWVAKCELGRLWYDANNLAEKHVAPFAILDTLTRVLPHWSGGILQINTNDVQLLWGVYGGPPSGAWAIIWQICRSHHIQLRAKWAALKSHEIFLPADPAKREALVPVRDENVVSTAVAELMQGDKTAYRK